MSGRENERTRKSIKKKKKAGMREEKLGGRRQEKKSFNFLFIKSYQQFKIRSK